MAANIRTSLYCFDAHRSFTEEIRKKFDDQERYVIHSFQSHDDLIASLKKEKENKSCKVSIIGVTDSSEQNDLTDRLTSEIRKISPLAGIILIFAPEKMDEVKKNLKFNIDAYIPQNSNFVLRVHNFVKKILSEHNITIHRKRRNRSLLVLFLFLVFSVLFAIFASFKFPLFF